MHRLALAVLLVPALAAADPSPGRVFGEAALLTGDMARMGGLGYDVAAAGRIGDLWLRGALTMLVVGVDEDGRVIEPHLGIEWRTLQRSNGAVFLGLEAGFVDGKAYIEDASFDRTVRGPFVMTRGGIEIGAEHLRVRLAVELIAGYVHTVMPDETLENPIDETGLRPGANITVGLIVR